MLDTSRTYFNKYLYRYGDTFDTQDLINDLMNEIDILHVDPRLFPEIIHILFRNLEKYKEEHNTRKIKKAEQYIQFIKSYPRRDEIKKKIGRPPPPPPPKIPALSPEQVQHEVELILDREIIKIYKDDELELVLAGLRQKRAEFIAKGDYLAAEKANHLLNILISHGQLGSFECMQRKKVLDLQEKLAAAENDLRIKKEKWEKYLENMRMKEKQDFENLERENQAVIESILKKREEEPPPLINKYSKEYLSLRRKQEASVLNHKFSEAETFRQQADLLKTKEDLLITQNWYNMIDKKLQNAKQEQEKIWGSRKAFWRDEKQTLVNDANKEVDKAQKAIEHLQQTLMAETHTMETASTLKKETRQVKDKNPLPELSSSRPTTKDRARYRQKRILNIKIYTRKLPRSTVASPRGRNKMIK